MRWKRAIPSQLHSGIIEDPDHSLGAPMYLLAFATSYLKVRAIYLFFVYLTGMSAMAKKRHGIGGADSLHHTCTQFIN
jgi:hypothetical protein